ncbi:MAG: FKBP-type peptidyl-prolyl cis-trans isomerase [Salibacteraceae bacterium]|jgi:FKBP-type peptidyl-prolyl cis-trans isomerase
MRIYNWTKISAVAFLFLSLLACEEPKKVKQQRIVTKKEMADHNRQSVRMEADQIDKYISRRGWVMEKTGSGLRYMVYEPSYSNEHAKENDTVYVTYEVSLISGKTIYKSDSNQTASFIVGHDEVESGLQEGIRFLSKGDKSMLIIPSHLAHGYTGDFNKIPRSSTVIFDITLVRIND